ncbi:MAG: phospholipase D-like domain-containing protein [Luteibacter sp.]
MRAIHTSQMSAGSSKLPPYVVIGTNASARFTLKAYRGEGMVLLAMNWRKGKPPKDFVGFAIEYRQPKAKKFYPVNNRLGFLADDGSTVGTLSSLLSPIQKFRWIHFPFDADRPGEFTYRVTPVFMDKDDQLTYGEQQEIDIVLSSETYPGKLNVTFTRGFVASQAFVDRYGQDGSVSSLLPPTGTDQLKFKPTHPKAEEALAWMGFETRRVIFSLLDEAIADKTCEVSVIAYDLQDPEFVDRFKQLKGRLRIIIDDSSTHGATDSEESRSAKSIASIIGKKNVIRQHMSNLQHNKIIIVKGKKIQKVAFGSTNMSWRGLYVQNNNTVVVQGESTVNHFQDAFEAYWSDPGKFRASACAAWMDLDVPGVACQITFSPHAEANLALDDVAKDMLKGTSSVLYSLAFLPQSPGAVKTAVEKIIAMRKVFLYGISERPLTGITLQKPNGVVVTASPEQLGKNVPEPFKPEPAGDSGIRMHHKFVVIDFNTPDARVYFGSNNFSKAADSDSGENLVLIRDPRIATSFAVEALRIFDHYSFRDKQDTSSATEPFALRRPPKTKSEKPWWDRDYADATRIRDRELFSS